MNYKQIKYYFIGMYFPDSLRKMTVILQNAAVVPGHLQNRYRTFGPGPGLTIGATNYSSS